MRVFVCGCQFAAAKVSLDSKHKTNLIHRLQLSQVVVGGGETVLDSLIRHTPNRGFPDRLVVVKQNCRRNAIGHYHIEITIQRRSPG